jgi:hypothetical protein
MNMKDYALICSSFSVFFAFCAATSWMVSARIKMPTVGSAFDNLTPLYAAVQRVAVWNASAAFCAFVSATAQAASLYILTYLAR